jgi:peptidoglycan hydrolase-like protein with peptidoglycan-binding domain
MARPPELSAPDRKKLRTVSVQSELVRRGYYRGAVDGVIGSGSRQANRAFQTAQGLPVAGLIDPKLLKALGISYKKV